MYSLAYMGHDGAGFGAMFMGGGKVAGFDIYGGAYTGSYTDQPGGGRKVTISLVMPGGGKLVTGQPMPPNQVLAIEADLPSGFGQGHPIQVSVSGQPVTVQIRERVAID